MKAKKKRRKSIWKCEKCRKIAKGNDGWYQYGASKWGKKYDLNGIASWCPNCKEAK